MKNKSVSTVTVLISTTLLLLSIVATGSMWVATINEKVTTVEEVQASHILATNRKMSTIDTRLAKIDSNQTTIITILNGPKFQ